LDQSPRRIDCPWCLQDSTQFLLHADSRDYLKCLNCDLIFVPRTQLVTEADEFNRYQKHDNELTNLNYLNYFEKIIKSTDVLLSTPKSILDYGCGKSRVIEFLLKDKKHKVFSYDKYFYPDQSIYQNKYDIIYLIEVIEHLREPRRDIDSLRLLLNPNGKIVVKTKIYPDLAKFKNWYYKTDVTHIQFFAQKSLEQDSIFSISD
jgi:2-polyprenyl-3-methyl-5-hydroxy-6-metoxy-1,4-benzoquinol methylase